MELEEMPGIKEIEINNKGQIINIKGQCKAKEFKKKCDCGFFEGTRGECVCGGRYQAVKNMNRELANHFDITNRSKMPTYRN